jgi:hypothetical protein
MNAIPIKRSLSEPIRCTSLRKTTGTSAIRPVATDRVIHAAIVLNPENLISQNIATNSSSAGKLNSNEYKKAIRGMIKLSGSSKPINRKKRLTMTFAVR